MSNDDDKTPPPNGFNWGLRPSDEEPENEIRDDAKPETEPEPAAPLDLGHFLALNQTEMIAAATESSPIHLPVDDAIDEGEPTAAFDFRAPPPPPVDPIRPPVYHAGHALPWEQPPAFDASLDGATEVLSAESVGLDAPEGESAPTSAIDSLFAEEKFEEYSDAPVPVVIPVTSHELVALTPIVPPPPKPPRGPMPKSQKTLIGIAAGLLAALALVGLFLAGTRLPSPAPVAVATPSATPTPRPSETAVAPPAAPVVALGPVAPGVHQWKELLGTECLDPFVSAWESEYTVVDCATPHGGQLVYRGRFDESALDPYPGVDALQARMNLLCASPENIDYAAASQFDNIQISSSFAGTEDDWKSGNRNYFCFVSQSTGDPLTASVAMPARAPVVIPVVPSQEP